EGGGGLRRVTLGLAVFIRRFQAVVAVQYLVHHVGDLRLKRQIGNARVHLGHGNEAGVDRNPKTLQETLLEGKRQTGGGRRIQHVGGGVLVQVNVGIRDGGAATRQ